MTPNGKPSRKLKIPCANNTCGFDPHHRHKKEALQLVWGLSFYLRRVRREQHCTLSQKKRPDFVGTFFFICGASCVRRQFCSALFRPCRECFLPPVFIAAVLPGISGNDRLFCRKVVLYPRKKHQNPAPAIYSTVSYRFYNVFYEKGFTNEFQKHII